MTFYEQELNRIKQVCYANQAQIDLVIQTRNYIEKHLDQNLNLDNLAAHRFVSKYHLLRLFKRYYGQTPRQYIMQVRVAKAKELLRNGTKVTDACFAVGFESPTSFSNLFKTKVGMSPNQYRKEQLSIRNLA